MREKLVFTSTFRFKYQLRPTDQAEAELADVAGSAKKSIVAFNPAVFEKGPRVGLQNPFQI